MQDSVKQFFSELHSSHLKPRGYKKIRHMFHGEMDGYVEQIQFQGSSWNDANSPWLFYINFGVEFSGMPARSTCRGFHRTVLRRCDGEVRAFNVKLFDQLNKEPLGKKLAAHKKKHSSNGRTSDSGPTKEKPLKEYSEYRVANEIRHSCHCAFKTGHACAG